MKKNAFFKYFIKNRVFAGGVEAGPRNPSPLEAGLGVKFLFPPSLKARAGLGTMKRERGWVC